MAGDQLISNFLSWIRQEFPESPDVPWKSVCLQLITELVTHNKRAILLLDEMQESGKWNEAFDAAEFAFNFDNAILAGIGMPRDSEICLPSFLPGSWCNDSFGFSNELEGIELECELPLHVEEIVRRLRTAALKGRSKLVDECDNESPLQREARAVWKALRLAGGEDFASRGNSAVGFRRLKFGATDPTPIIEMRLPIHLEAAFNDWRLEFYGENSSPTDWFFWDCSTTLGSITHDRCSSILETAIQEPHAFIQWEPSSISETTGRDSSSPL